MCVVLCIANTPGLLAWYSELVQFALKFLVDLIALFTAYQSQVSFVLFNFSFPFFFSTLTVFKWITIALIKQFGVMGCFFLKIIWHF